MGFSLVLRLLFELHADLSAARNIAAKYHASIARRDAGGLAVNEPIVSVATPWHRK